MGPLTLIVRRARAGLGLLLTILALTTATTAIIAGTLGYSQAAATTAARQSLADAPPTEAGLLVQTRLADDPAAQDALARETITDTFAPVPVLVQRSLISEPQTVSGQEERVVLTASSALTPQDERFAELVQVVAGDWPQGASGSQGEVGGALHASVAERWDVSVGDTITVGAGPVRVVAVWRPVDPQDAFWFGDPLIPAGESEGTAGPLVVPLEQVAALGEVPFTRWTVQPDPEQVSPSDLPGIAEAASRLLQLLRGSEVDVRGLTVEGDLVPTAATAGRNLAAAQALGVIPVGLLLLVSVIAVVQIARLQATARAREVELLVARGAARGQLLRWSAGESVLVVTLATTLGTLAALGVVQLVPGGDQQAAVIVRAGVLTGCAAFVAVLTILVLQVRSISARTATTDTSGRTRQVAALGTLVLTLGAAGLAWWQLDRYDSPLVAEADGTLRTDLLAGAAPALLLAAVAVVAMALLGPLGRLAEALTRPTRRLAGHLAASQVSRRLVVYAVPVVLTVLATGATTVAGVYAGTSAQLRDSLATLGQGATVRATLAPVPEGSPSPLGAVGQADGVKEAVPVWRVDTRLAQTPSQVTILPVESLGRGVLLPPGALDVGTTVAALAAPEPVDPIPLPADGGEVRVPLMVDLEIPASALAQVQADYDLIGQGGGDGFVPPELVDDDRAQFLAPLDNTLRTRVDLIVSDPRGQVVVPAGALDLAFAPTVTDGTVSVEPVAGRAELIAQLPPGADRRLLGVRVSLGQLWNGQFRRLDARYEARVVLDGLLTAGGGNLLQAPGAQAWRPGEPVPGAFGSAGTESTLAVDQDEGRLVLQATTGSAELDVTDPDDPDLPLSGVPLRPPQEVEQRVPVAVTQALAQANDLEVGEPLDLPLFGLRLPGTVAHVLVAVPGTSTPSAVLVDSVAAGSWLSDRGQSLPPPTEAWVETQDPQTVLDALAVTDGVASAVGPGSVTVTDAASAVRLVFWVASAGAVLLAVTGIGAVTTNLLRSRRPEVAVLRALGMTPSSQARSRVSELVGVILASVAAGLGAGWWVGASVVPELSRSTTAPGLAPLAVPLVLEPQWWAGLLATLALALLLLLAVTAVVVRRQALDREYREEVR